jgi:hypothetical protein
MVNIVYFYTIKLIKLKNKTMEVIIETNEVKSQVLFCSETDIAGDIWFFSKYSLCKYPISLSGSYDKEAAYNYYKKIVKNTALSVK